MNLGHIDSVTVKKYLLGRLSEEEAAQLEEKYFVDRALFRQVVAAERDLVSQYVERRLSSADYQQFERILPTMPALEELVSAAIARHRLAHNRRRRFALIAVGTGVALVSIIAFRTAIFRQDLHRNKTVFSPQVTVEAAAVVLHLTPGVEKGPTANVTRLAIPPGTLRVFITIDLPEGITTLNAGGSSFYCQPSVTATGTWSLPAACAGSASGAGTSTLKLTGLPITLSTSHLSTGVDPLVYGNFVVGAASTQTFTWMPQPPPENCVTMLQLDTLVKTFAGINP